MMSKLADDRTQKKMQTYVKISTSLNLGKKIFFRIFIIAFAGSIIVIGLDQIFEIQRMVVLGHSVQSMENVLTLAFLGFVPLILHLTDKIFFQKTYEQIHQNELDKLIKERK